MAHARQCDRCKRVVVPRGKATPRYCPVCGERLTGGPVEIPADQRPDTGGTSGLAIAALILGIVAMPSFILMLPLGLLAIIFGLSAKNRIQKSRGRTRGGALANAAIALGIIECVLTLLICRGCG